MKHIYNLLITLTLPLALLRLLWRSRKNPDYRQRLGERLAISTSDSKQAIWIHTVSVGEFLATLPLIEKLLADNEQLLITTTTPTGSAMVREKLSKRVSHQYLPFDTPFLVTRFLNSTEPRLAVFVETEIWANYLRELKIRNTPALLINARLSEKSLNGYQKLGHFAQETVANFTEVACQNEKSCERFKTLGAHATMLGNLKFGLHAPSDLHEKQQALKNITGERKFVLIASTHKGEEAIILDKYQSGDENRLLVIAPRHPERSAEVMTIVEKMGLKVARLTQIENLTNNCDVLIIDTLGQLLTFYSLADYAVIGGSFIPHGGHNPLEAALFATPCMIGEHYFNFESLVSEMLAEKAIEVVSADNLFTHEPNANLGNNAKQFLLKNQGAIEKYQRLIQNNLLNN